MQNPKIENEKNQGKNNAIFNPFDTTNEVVKTSNISNGVSIVSDTCSSWSKYSGALTIKSKEFKIKDLSSSYIPPLPVINATGVIDLDAIDCFSPLRPPETGNNQISGLQNFSKNEKSQNQIPKPKGLTAQETLQKIRNSSKLKTMEQEKQQKKNTFGPKRSTISKHLSLNPFTENQENKTNFNSNFTDENLGHRLSISSTQYIPQETEIVVNPTLKSSYQSDIFAGIQRTLSEMVDAKEEDLKKMGSDFLQKNYPEMGEAQRQEILDRNLNLLVEQSQANRRESNMHLKGAIKKAFGLKPEPKNLEKTKSEKAKIVEKPKSQVTGKNASAFQTYKPDKIIEENQFVSDDDSGMNSNSLQNQVSEPIEDTTSIDSDLINDYNSISSDSGSEKMSKTRKFKKVAQEKRISTKNEILGMKGQSSANKGKRRRLI